MWEPAGAGQRSCQPGPLGKDREHWHPCMLDSGRDLLLGPGVGAAGEPPEDQAQAGEGFRTLCSPGGLQHPRERLSRARRAVGGSASAKDSCMPLACRAQVRYKWSSSLTRHPSAALPGHGELQLPRADLPAPGAAFGEAPGAPMAAGVSP